MSDSRRIQTLEDRVMQLGDELDALRGRFESEIKLEMPGEVHDLAHENAKLKAEVAELEAQLGVTESTDSKRDRLRAGVREALAMWRMDLGLHDYLVELLIRTEPE